MLKQLNMAAKNGGDIQILGRERIGYIFNVTSTGKSRQYFYIERYMKTILDESQTDITSITRTVILLIIRQII